MSGVGIQIGVGVVVKTNASSGGGGNSGPVGLPKQFLATPNQEDFVLDAPARGVLVTVNQIPQTQTTDLLENQDFTHVTNSDTVSFPAPGLDNGDIVVVTPLY